MLPPPGGGGKTVSTPTLVKGELRCVWSYSHASCTDQWGEGRGVPAPRLGGIPAPGGASQHLGRASQYLGGIPTPGGSIPVPREHPNTWRGHPNTWGSPFFLGGRGKGRGYLYNAFGGEGGMISQHLWGIPEHPNTWEGNPSVSQPHVSLPHSKLPTSSVFPH